MAKNVILMIGDGMGWEMSRASAIQKQIEQEIAQIRTENPQITNEQIAARFDGRTLDDYYIAGKGTGTSYQNLAGYTIATTGNTYIDGNKSNSALQNDPKLPPNVFHHNTGEAKPRPGFEFDPSGAKVEGFTIQSAKTPRIAANQSIDVGFNEAPVLDDTGKMLGGNMPIFDQEQGGQTPWDDNYYQNRSHPSANFNQDYIKNLYLRRKLREIVASPLGSFLLCLLIMLLQVRRSPTLIIGISIMNRVLMSRWGMVMVATVMKWMSLVTKLVISTIFSTKLLMRQNLRLF
jgi:hypothetical protein